MKQLDLADNTGNSSNRYILKLHRVKVKACALEVSQSDSSHSDDIRNVT